MTDPRIRRTRLHVLETARDMLAARSDEPFTFTTLAARAGVSRRTLYTHWGSVERVVGDAVALRADAGDVDTSHLPPREALRLFLESVRERVADPVTRFALAGIMNRSDTDIDAARSLLDPSPNRSERRPSILTGVDTSTYIQLIGPVFFAGFLGGEPASDELIEALVDRGMELLERS